MKDNEYKHCILSEDIKCNNCMYCEKYGLEYLPSEDEIIEELIYRSEREADLI